MGMNVGQVLRQSARRHPERVAIVDLGAPGQPPNEVTYGALDAGAARVAGALAAAGVQPGARVGLMGANGRAFVEGFFGALYAGATVVPVPILSAPPEVAHRVDHAGCDLVLVDAERREVAQAGLSQAQRPAALAALEGYGAGAAPLDHPADRAPGDAAMVLYTSGTTGRAKGAALSHASLMTHTAILVHHALALGPADVVLGVLPLTHSFGSRMVLLAPFFAGARCVLMSRFDAARSLEAVSALGVTWIPAVPTMFAAWAGLPEGPRPGALRWALSAGAALPEDIRVRAEARLGAEVRQGYGMTEATFSTMNAPPDPRVAGTVGRPVWGIEVRVVDADDRDVPTGAIGQVLVRGHNVMTGYLDDPAATAEALRGGWMHTGDVGRLDAEGRLTVVDRTKDLIIRGGYNVYPSEVEQALCAHPTVAQAAVVGRPDPFYGEEVVAFVTAAPGRAVDAEALVAHCRERLSRYKVPREVHVVEAMPIGPSGKVVKRVLRDRLLAGDEAVGAAIDKPRRNR